MTEWLRTAPLDTVQAEDTNTRPADDDQLVQRALHDSEVFAVLYRRHVERVYRYLLYRVGNVHEAQDLTSETFVEVMRGLKRYRRDGRFAAWVIGIARYNANDHFRRRRTVASLDAISDLPESGDSPDETTEQRLTLERVRHALEKINPDRAEAIRLRMFAELSAAEIGTVMKKNEAAVRMLIYRGLTDLKQLLKEEA